jgi:transposase
MKERMMTQDHKLYVGIDLHGTEHKVALMPKSLLEGPGDVWKKVKMLTVMNNREDFELLTTSIMSHVSNKNEVIVAVDMVGQYSEPLIDFLQREGYAVYYLETRATKAARERLLDRESKSDLIDASSAAYLLYLRDTHGLSFRISSWTPEFGSKASVLRLLILQRLQFTKLTVQATNRLHQVLHVVFPEGESQYFGQLLKIVELYPTPSDMLNSNCFEGIKRLQKKTKKNILELAAKTVGTSGNSYRWLIKDLSIQRNEYLAKSAIITEMITKELDSHPYQDILFSFPFVGVITAATIVGIVKDINRWTDKKKFRKALGVYSTIRQSGTSTGRSRLGKEGSKDGRRALFQICFGCIKRNAPENDFRDYYLRQVAKGKPKMKAIVATMGKLAEIMYHCLKTREPYQYQGKYRSIAIS